MRNSMSIIVKKRNMNSESNQSLQLATQASEVKQKMLDKMMKGLKYRSDWAVKAYAVFGTILEQNCIMHVIVLRKNTSMNQ
jgi:hypothetical protein